MSLIFVAYFAGVLTVLAPCILPLLPVIIGGSVTGTNKKNWRTPLTITASLAVSVFIFSLLLKASTSLLGVPQMVWSTISGLIVLLFGINMLFPLLWEKFMVATRLNIRASELMGKSNKRQGKTRDILLGASLGPVFSSCSPTYALVVAVVLPASFIKGSIYLLAYSLGLASVLLLIALLGQSLVKKLNWAINPKGIFIRVLGALFIVVGITVLFGFDKDIQAFVLERGWYDWVSNIEQNLN